MYEATFDQSNDALHAPVIKLAQYLSGLDSNQDTWAEIGRAITAFFGAELAAVAELDESGTIHIHHWSFPDAQADESPHAAGPFAKIDHELKAEAAGVFTSGFLASRVFHTASPLAVCLLPISYGAGVRHVLVIGHRMTTGIPKNRLDMYLAVAGLVGITVERLTNERELHRHRTHLAELVNEQTRDLQAANEHLREEIIQRRQAERTAKQEQMNFIRILEALEDRIYIVNSEHTISYANPAFKRDFGEICVEKCYQLIHSETRACSWCRLGEVLAGHTSRWEWRSPKTGRIYDTIATPVQNSDDSTSMLTLFRDISERSRNEEEIRKLLDEKELLLQEVHHRIKNNMLTMKSILSLQAETVGDAGAKQALSAAQNRMTGMMILYDKLYRGDTLEEISMREYLESLVNAIIPTYSHRVWLHIELPETPLPIRIAAPLGIIVNELIANAMKHAFAGSAEDRLTITGSRKGTELQLTVRDNGQGLPQTGPFEGFGIELVRSLTEQIDGRFTIESDAGTKCTVEFDLERDA